MRAFIAVPLSPSIDLEIVSDMVRSSHPGLRMVREENRHLTLAFLEEVSEEDVCRLEAHLRTALLDYKRFSFQVVGLGAFPNSYSPRVIWCGVSGQDLWSELNSRVVKALSLVGIRLKPSSFHPHITVARNPSVKGSETLSRLLKNEGHSVFGDGCCEDVHIMRSEPGSRGPHYEVVSRINLMT